MVIEAKRQVSALFKLKEAPPPGISASPKAFYARTTQNQKFLLLLHAQQGAGNVRSQSLVSCFTRNRAKSE